MTADRHTTEQAPRKPLSAPLATSAPEVGTRAGSAPLNGPQEPAGGLGLLERITQTIRNTPARYPDDIAAAVWRDVQTELAGHYQHAVDTAIAAERRAERAEAKLRRYRDWLATQHANAARADQAGDVPDHLKISPHNGIAAGLHTALLGLYRALNPHDAGPTIAECAEADARWWNGEKDGER